MSSSKELGLYSVAVAWSEVLFFLPTTLVAVQRPDLVTGKPRGGQGASPQVLRGALALTLACTVVIVVLAPFLCTTIFGRASRGRLRCPRARPRARSGSQR